MMIAAKTKNIIIGLLLIGLLTLSYLWIDSRQEVESYKFQQLADFQSSLIDLDNTFNNLYELLTATEFNHLSDREHKLFSLVVKDQMAELERIMARIRTIEARIDPRKEHFARDFSIDKLLSVIKQMEDVGGGILETRPMDQEKAYQLQQLLARTSAERSSLIWNTSTDQMDTPDFKNRFIKLISTLDLKLREIQ